MQWTVLAKQASPGPPSPSAPSILCCAICRASPADARLAAEVRSAVDAASAPSSVICLSPGPDNVAPASAAPALQPAEDPVLKELDKLLARLNAGPPGLPPPPSAETSAKRLKSRFFR
jgi:hypothetical protein